MNLRKRVKKTLIALAIIALLALFCHWQNNGLVVTEVEVLLPQNMAALDGCTIVHLSDLHNHSFGHRQERLLDLVGRQSPDFIVITGDIVDSRRTDFDPALDLVRGAVELAPTFYVTGNHEERLSKPLYQELIHALSNTDLVVLQDRAVQVPYGDASLWLLGVDDTKAPPRALTQLKQAVSADAYQILLAHRPNHFAFYANSGVDLVFSGHAHGGQIRLPFVGGLVAPDQGLFPTYDAGSFQQGKTTMVVSRGLGNSVFPLRLFNRPEVVVVHLVAQ